MGIQNIMDTMLRHFVIDKDGVLLQYKGKATHVTIPNRIRVISHNAFDGNDMLESVTIPPKVTIIQEKAFRRCGRLREVHFSEGLYNIGEKAFEYCTSLQKLELPAGCCSIGKSAFLGCSSLQKITLPDSLVVVGDSAFLGCTELEEIILPNSVKELGDSAFYACKKLRTVQLPKRLGSLPASLFSECIALETLVLPDSIRSIQKKAVSKCTALVNVTFPRHLFKIGNNAFLGCTSLREVVLPQGLHTIETGAFSECRQLKEVTFLPGLKHIGSHAFLECIALRSVSLPEGLETIESSAFQHCTLLKTVQLPSTVRTFGENCFFKTPWLQDYPKEMVIEGDGVLLEYRGHAKRLELPPHVKTVHERAFPAGHTPKTLVISETLEQPDWRFIPGLELVFRRKGRSVTLKLYSKYTTQGQDEYHILQFWKLKTITRRYHAFWSIHDPAYKLPLGVLMFLTEPQDEYFSDYVRKNAKDVLKNLIDRNDLVNLETFIELGFVNTGNVDELIEYAIANARETGHHEPQLALMNYKGKVVSYSGLEDIISDTFKL